MLSQEMGFYDNPENSTGALCSRLAADAAAVQGATGSRLGSIIPVFFTLMLAVGAGLYFNGSWGWSGVSSSQWCLWERGFKPRLSHLRTISRRMRVGLGDVSYWGHFELSPVAGLRLEETLVERYGQELAEPHAEAKKKAHIRGLVFGFAQSVPFFAYSAACSTAATSFKMRTCLTKRL